MSPQRILIVLPCCIGDVIMATASLAALRRAYSSAHIAWAVGAWSKAAIQHHPALNAILDTGSDAQPYKSVGGLLHLARMFRVGHYDLMVSFVRSPLMSIAALLSGIPMRAGLDSGGRGFGYTLRVPVDPDAPRHEAEIYLDVLRALGVDTSDCYANIPVLDTDRAAIREKLNAHGITGRFIVVHPGGGRNPGMTLDAKRYPPDMLAALATRLSESHTLPPLSNALERGSGGEASLNPVTVVVIGSPSDQPLVDALASSLTVPHAAFTDLTFGQIAALAAESSLYIGNDTGMTHLAAASGAKTVAIFGPTDPRRYAPYARDVLALWRPAAVGLRGVASGEPADWDWDRDGISVDHALDSILHWASNVNFP